MSKQRLGSSVVTVADAVEAIHRRRLEKEAMAARGEFIVIVDPVAAAQVNAGDVLDIEVETSAGIARGEAPRPATVRVVSVRGGQLRVVPLS